MPSPKFGDSSSTAWVSSARAPLRRISVRESVNAPGWVNLITLLSDTAYHSFIGEVEALNTTTIRRLTPSRRHQLLAIARSLPLPQEPRRTLSFTEEMMATSTDPVGEIAAHGKSGKSPCKGMTEE